MIRQVFQTIKVLPTSILLGITTFLLQESINNKAYAVTAKEMVNFSLAVPGRGTFRYDLSYKVSIKEDGTFFEERILNASTKDLVIKGVSNSVIEPGLCMEVTRLQWMCNLTFIITTQIMPPDTFQVMFTTTVEQRFENDLIKEQQKLLVNGNQIFLPPLPGFEFKDQKQPNEYVLHNNSNEDFTVNRLLVRTNKNQLDFSSFDINNPDSISWDFELTNPFTLEVGEEFILPINTLTPGLFSQFWADVTGNTSGSRVLELGEHEHPIPEPTSTLGLLSLGILGAGATLKRKVKRNHSIEKEPTNVG